MPIFIPPIAPQSPSSIIWGWYNRSVVAAVPSGLSLTPLRIIKLSLLLLRGSVDIYIGNIIFWDISQYKKVKVPVLN
jgi:hypothetical protein